jgi:thymidylate synthase (FAD)
MSSSLISVVWVGNDLTVVNAAKASFAKRATTMTDAAERLLHFLWENKHTSPYRHVVLRFELETTLIERIKWETGQTNSRGQVFMPSLYHTVIDEQTYSLSEMCSWRWTASLEAVARWVMEMGADADLAAYADDIIDSTLRLFPYAGAAVFGIPEAEVVKTPIKMSPAPKWAEIPVLGDGYVRYVQHLPGQTDDESIITFEIKAPLIIRAQWFKHTGNSAHTPAMLHPFEELGSGNGDDGNGDDGMYARNEASRRYVSLTPEFYVPSQDQWRRSSVNKKQGSGAAVDPNVGLVFTEKMKVSVAAGIALYEEAIQSGIAPEQARVFLPSYALHTNWYWTGSMTAVKHFLGLRLGKDAQSEIREYAKAVEALVKKTFGKSI